MSRFAAKITKKDFKEKLFEAIKKHEDCDEYILEEIEEAGDNVPYECSYILCTLNKKLNKDIGKVKFDLENFECSQEDCGIGNYELGLRELDNGLVYLACAAGGDWEWPVFFIIYWDGSTFRAYIPKDGNMWNKKYNTAYGSETEDEDYDGDGEFEEPKEKVDMNKIKEDIKKRILIK